jgi:hypothetical protein
MAALGRLQREGPACNEDLEPPFLEKLSPFHVPDEPRFKLYGECTSLIVMLVCLALVCLRTSLHIRQLR